MKHLALASFLLFMCLSGNVISDTTIADNDFIETFVCSLDKHITWPADRVTEGNGKFLVVAAVGDTVWTAELKKLWGKKTSTDKRIKIRVVDLKSLPSNSHIVIVASEDTTILKSVLDHLKGTGTLIITKGPGFTGFGSMINFYKDSDAGSTMKFELNLDAFTEEKMEVSKALQEYERILTGK